MLFEDLIICLEGSLFSVYFVRGRFKFCSCNEVIRRLFDFFVLFKFLKAFSEMKKKR